MAKQHYAVSLLSTDNIRTLAELMAHFLYIPTLMKKEILAAEQTEV